MPRDRRVALVLALAVTATVCVSAHRRDECLQAARIAVEPHAVRLELDLTPGIAVADAVITAIDRDRDGGFSAAEQRAYIADVRAALRLEIDGQRLPVDLVTSSFADSDALRRGEGTIRLAATGALPRLASGSHRLVFRNGYRPDLSVYLANALVPASDRVAIARQARDADQRELTIDYDLRSDAAGIFSPWMPGGFAALALVAAFLLRPSRAHGSWRRRTA